MRELSIERPVLEYVERTMTIQVSQWKPSEIAKSRIAKRRSMFIHGMDATCLAAVYIAILFILTPLTPQHPGNKPVDLPTVKHSVPMPGAHREDATIVTVTRDGNVFVGNTQVQLADLPSQIAKSLAQGGERKGYLKADARAKYGDVKAVIECIKGAGIENIGLITN